MRGSRKIRKEIESQMRCEVAASDVYLAEADGVPPAFLADQAANVEQAAAGQPFRGRVFAKLRLSGARAIDDGFSRCS